LRVKKTIDWYNEERLHRTLGYLNRRLSRFGHCLVQRQGHRRNKSLPTNVRHSQTGRCGSRRCPIRRLLHLLWIVPSHNAIYGNAGVIYWRLY